MHTVFMFPGQGAQSPGMGKDLADAIPEVAEIYRKANEIAGYDLADMCFSGSEEELARTDNAQPAIFVTSAACLLALRHGKIGTELKTTQPDVCAGLSLGEYTALYAAGAMDFPQALRLVLLRGRSMQEAAEQSSGAMVSILGLEEEKVNQLCEDVLAEAREEDDEPAMLTPVNFNCPGQVVISGTRNACKLAADKAENYGAIKAIPLKVAGAFHTKKMEPAAEKLKETLNDCVFSPLICPVVSNVNARPYPGTDEITGTLIEQLVSPVRWEQSIDYLLDQGAVRFVEIGPGRVLTGLLKKISRARKQKVQLYSLSGLDS